MAVTINAAARRSAWPTATARSRRASTPTSSSGTPDSHALLPYWLGADLVRTVVKRGRVVYARG